MKKLLKFFDDLHITHHGRENFIAATGMYWTLDTIKETVMASKAVKVKDLIIHGYNPNYAGRAGRGIKSWYAISDQFGWDAVFVLSNNADDPYDDQNALILVTVLYNRIETWNSCVKPKTKPKPKQHNYSQHICPGTVWKSSGIVFQCMLESGRLMFKSYDKTGKLNACACTAEGRKRFRDKKGDNDPDYLLKVSQNINTKPKPEPEPESNPYGNGAEEEF